MKRTTKARLILFAALVVAFGVLVGFAINSPSRPITRVTLHDSGIWVTNNADDLLGRMNMTGGRLDGYLSPGATASGDLDVLQDGASVVARDIANGRLTPIDPKRVVNETARSVAMPPTSLVAMAAGTIASLDTTTGALRAARYQPGEIPDVLMLDPAATPLVVLTDLIARSTDSLALVIDSAGTVHAVSGSGSQVVVAQQGPGFADPVVRAVGPPMGDVTATAVGDQLVCLDSTTGAIELPGGRSAMLPDGRGAVLQQPGPAGSVVFAATRTGLYAVKLDGSAVTAVATGQSGAPALPVVVAGAVYAAWAGQPGHLVAGPADGSGKAAGIGLDRDKTLTQPVFRVNHDRVLLNDMADGQAFDVVALRSLDDWQSIVPPPSEDVGDSQQTTTRLDDAPPVAQDDNLGARPGRTTVLHVLDNDTNSQADILAVTQVTQPAAAKTAVSADGQSVLFTAPAGLTAKQTFTYTVSNGHGESVAQVSVTMKLDSQNGTPAMRAGYAPITYPVASRGTVGIFVAQDWRDPDGDPVSVVEASVDGTPVPVGPEGKIYYTAPNLGTDTTVMVDYVVSDGHTDATANGQVPVKVLSSKSTVAVSPIAQADLVRGTVGVPLTFAPLQNDIAGADPRDPTAKLALAGSVAAPAGLKVNTDLVAGTVTVVAESAGTYTLNYTAAFGSAAFNQGVIRCEIAERADLGPVAMPDNLTVRGTVAATIDVLANDADPANSLLTVTAVTADDPDQLTVTVFGGRWVRVQPATPELKPNPQIVHYSVTDGRGDPVESTIAVTQIQAPAADSLILGDDRAVVRSGDSALVDVLSNDSSQSGKPLVLREQPDPGLPAGQLPVLVVGAAATDQVDAGQAFAVGNKVRYIAPAGLLVPMQVAVTYAAMTSDGGVSQSATLYIDVHPDDGTNSAPQPRRVEARATSGDKVTVQIPIYGVDPDGDSITVTGIASAPQLGRVVSISPTSITYQSFPDEGNTGTDSFDYVVSDRYGSTGVGQIEIGLAPPDLFPASVAVDDMVTAQPGVPVTVQPLVNDLVAQGDHPQIVPVGGLPAGVSLSDDGRTFLATSPAQQTDPPLQFSYLLRGAGGDGPTATITIKAQDGYLNPPRVYDTVAVVDQTGNVTTATADPLSTAWDIDGLKDQIRLASIEAGTLTPDGKVADIPVLDHAQALIYVASDGDGNLASAIVFVPPAGASLPSVRPGVTAITLQQNETKTVALNDYVFSPRGRTVRITVADRLSAAPVKGLAVQAGSPTSLTLTGLNDYVGPAAISLQVTDAADDTDNTGLTSFVTIPVQVGPPTPVLRCPTTAQQVVQGGGERWFDIGAICHVWTPDDTTAQAIVYTATWVTALEGVSATGGDGVAVTAAGSAVPGSSGRLRIGVANSPAVPAEMTIDVVAASKPKVSAPDIVDVPQGSTVTQRVAVSSPLQDASPTIISVRQTGGDTCRIGSVDGTTFTLTPGADVHGVMTFQVVASDLADPSRTERQVTTTFTMTVYGRPDVPSPPEPGTKLLTHSVALSWSPPNDNGASILEYEVQSTDGHYHKSCGQFSRCDITGVPNGQPISFQVRARNKAGWSDWSAPGEPFTPNEAPGKAMSFVASDPQDGRLTLTWGPAPVDGTPVTAYHLSWTGGGAGNQDLPGTATAFTVTGLDNNQITSFSLVAENDAGLSAATATTTGQSSGRPYGLDPPVVSPNDLGDTAEVTVSWGAANPNGPGPVTYHVTRTDVDGVVKTLADATTDTSVLNSVDYDGAQYKYTVTATNATGGDAHTSDPAETQWAAVGKPVAWPVGSFTAAATGNSGEVEVKFTYPASRGASAFVNVLVDGNSKTVINKLNAKGDSDSVLLTGLTNGAEIAITLMLCNESNNCTTTPDSITVVPYGPLSKPEFVSDSKGAVNSGDRQVCTTFKGTGNGRNARLHIWATDNVAGTPDEFFSDYAPGLVTQQYCVNATKANVTVTFHAVMQNDGDDSIRDDSAQTDHGVTSAYDPVVLTVTAGAYHKTTGCGDPSCRYVSVSGNNLNPKTEYTIYYHADNEDGAWATQTVTTDSRGHFSLPDGPVYGYPNRHVWVVITVHGVDVASNHYTW